MRFYEFKTNYMIEGYKTYRPTGIKVDDGEFFITDHFLDRIKERGITGREISVILHRAIDLHKDKILAIEPSDFAIKTREGKGIGISKILQPDDRFKYVLVTAHPNMKVGPHQTVIVTERKINNKKDHYYENI